MSQLFHRHQNNPIITAKDIPYPVNTVFNAGVTKINNETLLLLRCEDKRGVSHLTVARSKNGIDNWRISPEPTIISEPDKHPEETLGVEDSRIIYLEDKKEWIITYTALSKDGPAVSLASTADFKTFHKMGPVLIPVDKDAALFPVKINDRYAMLHRPMPRDASGAHIWLTYSPDLKHWGDDKCIMRSRGLPYWDCEKIGLSTPPVKTDKGWLFVFHGVKKTCSNTIYRLGLALLDINDPAKVIKRSNEWVMTPETDYENVGDVDKVLFPCGWVVEDDDIRMYYGAADTCIGLATAKVSELLDWLL